mmetsp:Transcript_10297/g.23803  ORF Transcript_10297/g.23803 Transcript_10297/m.23803 type:complete len:224 (-) Transcript_10297:299-970(-)
MHPCRRRSDPFSRCRTHHFATTHSTQSRSPTLLCMWGGNGRDIAQCHLEYTRTIARHMWEFRIGWTTRFRESAFLSNPSQFCSSLWMYTLAVFYATGTDSITGTILLFLVSTDSTRWISTLFDLWRWIGHHGTQCLRDDTRTKTRRLRNLSTRWSYGIHRSGGVCRFASFSDTLCMCTRGSGILVVPPTGSTQSGFSTMCRMWRWTQGLFARCACQHTRRVHD